MKVQGASSQPGHVSESRVLSGGERGAQLPASPAVFDTSATDNAQQRGPADVNSLPSAALTPPAQGAPDSVAVQDQSGVESVWKRDQNGKPVLIQAYGATNADGSRANIATEFKLDENGNPVLIGARLIPAAPHDSSEDDTQWTVFKRGFNDGFTHPARTVGKIVDMATGDQSHGGEKAGEQVDEILENAPVVGNALKLTRGLVGEKEADGGPSLATPDAQPDAGETIHEKGLTLTSSKSVSFEEPGVQPGSTKEASAKEVSAGGNSTPAQPAKPDIDASPTTNVERVESRDDPLKTSGADTTASSTGNARFALPTRYAQKPSGRLQADPDSPGVFRDDKQQAYIKADGETYPVRFDKDNGTWRVYRPDDPAKPQYPVRVDAQGNWQVHNDVGLKGGGGDARRPGVDGARQGDVQPDFGAQQMQLANQRQQLLQQRQNVQNQLQHFPGPQDANRPPLELAMLQNMLQNQLNNINNQLQNVEQQLQQLQ